MSAPTRPPPCPHAALAARRFVALGRRRAKDAGDLAPAFSCPAAVVLAGYGTPQEWCDLLGEARGELGIPLTGAAAVSRDRGQETRRLVLEALSSGPLPASELARRVPQKSETAVREALRVLEVTCAVECRPVALEGRLQHVYARPARPA